MAVWTLVYLLNELGHPIASRLLPPTPTALFLIATVFLVTTYPLAGYLRAHKREPLLAVSVMVGLATALVTWLLAKYSSVTGLAIGYLIISVTTLPVVSIVWIRCRRTWHGS